MLAISPPYYFFLLLLVVIVVLAIPILTKASQVNKDVLGENETGKPETVTAKIVQKKTYTPNYSVDRFNFVIFEKENGERIEMVIKNNEEYKLMIEGDVGKLTSIGKKYISFIR